MKVLVSVSLLVLLAFAVGALPLKEVTDTPVERHYGALNTDWSELGEPERMLIMESVEKEVGSAVGPIYVTLSSIESAFRASKKETILFDTYGIMLPRGPLPCVILSPATSTNPDEVPPPFQTPPLSNIPIRREQDESYPEVEPLRTIPNQIPSEYHNQRIPNFVYYGGVPVLLPKALGKIAIKTSVVDKILSAREVL